MATVLTKSQTAAALGVTPGAVTNWIRRGRLTSPALRSDGKIDVEQARAQLGLTLDPGGTGASTGRPPAVGPDQSRTGRASEQLMAARAISASVDAMRKRREFMTESGKYMLTADVEEAWARTLTRLFQSLDAGLQDLVLIAQLSPQQQVALRRWWRRQRQRAADEAGAAAAGESTILEDTTAAA